MNDVKDQEEPIKLVIMGMENAGKTTIVDLLIQETEETPKKTPNMIPTKGIVRRPLSQRNIMIWDFGGQELYRNEYITNPESYLYKISYTYFVLDIQDYYRYVAAYMYFCGIFQFIRKFSPNAKLVFLFHKMDPEFDPSEKNLKEQFLERIEFYLQANKTSFTYYDTTIFDLNSIKAAFSQI